MLRKSYREWPHRSVESFFHKNEQSNAANEEKVAAQMRGNQE